VDNNAIQIGMPVEMVTRKMRNDGDERGLIVYGNGISLLNDHATLSIKGCVLT